MREQTSRPESAIFAVPSIREARILTKKDKTFVALQHELRSWRWESLQKAANEYAGEILVEQAEIVIKSIRALLLQDELALSEMAGILLNALSDAIAVQKGILSEGGNALFRQVQEAVGLNSPWVVYHRIMAGIDVEVGYEIPVESKGVAAIHLYQKTAGLFRCILSPSHNKVVEQTRKI